MEIRDLKADEIECKVSNITEKGIQLLLYKTARTDKTILDETYGEEGWYNEYEEIKGNLFCAIYIWSEKRSQWLKRQDCGVESEFGDKEKGEASDSFKRAGFKVGIGVELYTSPFIWIDNTKCNIYTNNKGKLAVRDTFYVSAIEIENKKITGLEIKNNKNVRVFLWKK